MWLLRQLVTLDETTPGERSQTVPFLFAVLLCAIQRAAEGTEGEGEARLAEGHIQHRQAGVARRMSYLDLQEPIKCIFCGYGMICTTHNPSWLGEEWVIFECKCGASCRWTRKEREQ